MKDNEKPQCHCIIRHVFEPEERKRVRENMEIARASGDSMGIAVCMGQLSSGDCPAAKAYAEQAEQTKP